MGRGGSFTVSLLANEITFCLHAGAMCLQVGDLDKPTNIRMATVVVIQKSSGAVSNAHGLWFGSDV